MPNAKKQTYGVLFNLLYEGEKYGPAGKFNTVALSDDEAAVLHALPESPITEKPVKA